MADNRSIFSRLEYVVPIGVVAGLVIGAGLFLLLGPTDQAAPRDTVDQTDSPCLAPPSNASWNASRPASGAPVQTLTDTGLVTGEGDSPPLSVTYTARRMRNSSVFAGVAHDNILFRHGGETYLLTQFHCSHLFRSETGELTEPDDWTVVRRGVFYPTKPPGQSVDALLNVEGRWYAYTGKATYTSESLVGNWTRHDKPGYIDDVGAYHANGTFHLLYEARNTSGRSGSEIGHATSPTGVGNWTDHGRVYTDENGYKTGDYAIIKQSGLYLVFTDYTRAHPNYSIALLATRSLSSNLTRIGTVASPVSDSSVQPERGIQDPTVIDDTTRDRIILFAHVHENRRRLHHATVNVSVSEAGG